MTRSEKARSPKSFRPSAGLRLAFAASALALAAACSSPEERVERFSASGVEFLEAGEIGKANVQFQNALKINEEHVPSLLGLSRIAEERQDFRSMFGLLQRVVRLDPNQIEARVNLGKIYLVGGDETSALEQAEEALAIAPDDNGAVALKAAVQLRLGDYAGAVELARRVVARDPANAEAVTVLATERMVAEDPEAALAELDKALAVNPEIAVLQLLKIRVLTSLERGGDVLETYEQLVALYPEEAVYRRAYARELIGQGDYSQALAQLEKTVEIEPGNLDAKVDVIRMISAMENADAGEAKLRGYVDAEPDNTDLRFALVDFLRGAGKPDAAGAVLEELASMNEQDISFRAKNAIAADRLGNGDRAGAQALIDEILEADDRNTDALIKRASLKIEDEDYDNAIVDLRTALDNEPDAADAMVVMSTAFERQGNISFAQSELAKAFEASERGARYANAFARFLVRHDNFPRAEEVLVDSLAAHAGDVDNLQLLAGVRLQMQDWRGAEEVARILDEINARADAGDIADTIRTAVFTGLEDYDSLIDNLSARNDSAPLESRPLATLVAAYMRTDRADEAETLLRRVIASGGEDYAARILLAQVYGERDNNDEAEALLIEAADRDPSRPEAYELLYRYYVGAGRNDRAIELIDDGLAKAPDNVALRVFRADILLSQGQRAEALEMYADLIEERPNDLIIANNFVSLSSELRLDEASIARALEISALLEEQDNAFFRDTVGWANYRAGDYEKALVYLEQAAEGAPENPEILYHLGAAQAASGDAEAARATLERALAIAGENAPFSGDARTLLEGL